MRRTISILLVIFGLTLLLTGIRNIPIPCFEQFIQIVDQQVGLDIWHAGSGGVFAILLIIHVWLNRKPLFRYFRNLGWWWILVGLGFLTVIWLGIVFTFFFA